MKNKKGQLFTISAILIITIFLLSYIIYNVESDRKSIHNRVDSMNSFVISLKEDLRRQMYITGFRIIFLLEKKIVDTGEPIINLNSSFEEGFYNGTIDSEYQELLYGVTFKNISDSLSDKANRNNLNISLIPYNLSISQEDPWHVKMSLYVNIYVLDKNNLASWNNTETISSYIDITNFEDPLYIIYAKNKNNGEPYPNKINKSEYIFSDTSITNLSLEYQNSYYIASSLGPSFLDRLEGKTSANHNGIESLVKCEDIMFRDRSAVDYIYFSSESPDSSHHISGMPGCFKLDIAHYNIYNISGGWIIA